MFQIVATIRYSAKFNMNLIGRGTVDYKYYDSENKSTSTWHEWVYNTIPFTFTYDVSYAKGNR